jgi:hypothetical protein
MVHAGRAVVILARGVRAGGQSTTKPINDLPNPYQTIQGCCPDGRA